MSDIPNPNPLTIPAVEAKVYDKQFCTRLEITAHPDKPWGAKFIGMPFDGTSITYPAFQVELKDLQALAAHDAELAQAMGAVLAIVGKYLVKCKVANKHTVTVNNIDDILE